MPKLEKLEITLENPSRVYFPGNFVTGSALIVLSEEMKLRAVRLQISGEANVRFGESRGSGKNRHTDYFTAKAIYLSTEVALWGNPPGSSEDSKMLPAGSHKFNFQFQLPPQCATSYEGTYGSIRYFLKVIMDRPWKFDHTAKLPFTVIELHDLNREPNAAQSVQGTNRKTLIFSSGDLSATVILPRMGFVAGEVIPIGAQIDNTTKRAIKRIEVRLVQTASFTGYHCGTCHVRTCSNTVAEMQKNEDIPEGKTTRWTNEPFQIPPVPPMLRSCNLINLAYTLEFSVVPHGPSFDLDVKVPIIIGTIPLQQNFQHFQANPNAPWPQPTAPAMAATGNFYNNPAGGTYDPIPPSYTAMYPDLPPPSYEESTNVKGNIRDEGDNEHTKGEMDFSPRYPYYKPN